MIAYELWETRSGNLIASYASEDLALDVVAKTVARYGEDNASSFALLQADEADEDAEPKTIATGRELVALAQSRAAKSLPSSSLAG